MRDSQIRFEWRSATTLWVGYAYESHSVGGSQSGRQYFNCNDEIEKFC